MNEFFVIAAIVLVTIVFGILIWLIRENKKLKQRFNILSSYVERNNKDIAGLCSAAVFIDGKLSDSHEQLKDIVEKVTDFEQHEQQGGQPYHDAIQRIRNGATDEELITQCGLSRDEAVLLLRLHG